MELFNVLSLKEIADIICILGESHESIKHSYGNLHLENKDITFLYENDELIIQSNTGEKTNVKISFSKQEGKDYNGRKITYLSHECFINYYLQDGSIISLYKELSLPEGYEGFENVQRHNLLNGLRIKYYDKEGNQSTFSLTADKICIDENKIFEFTNEGIKYGNKIISLDGDKLVLSGGSTAPSLDVINSFDLEKEKDRITKFANIDSDIHPFTKEVLESAARELSRKKRNADSIKEFYDKEIKDVRRAIKIRSEFINDVTYGIMNSEELEKVANEFRREVKGYNYKKQKE